MPASEDLWGLDNFLKKMWVDDLDHLSRAFGQSKVCFCRMGLCCFWWEREERRSSYSW